MTWFTIFIHPETVFDLRKHKRAVAAHEPRVALHYPQVRADGGGEIRFIDDQKVGLCDAGPALARNFVSPGNVNDVDGVIRQFTAEVGGQVSPPDSSSISSGVKLLVEFLQRQQMAEMSSRMAACGHPPVSTARMRSASSA